MYIQYKLNFYIEQTYISQMYTKFEFLNKLVCNIIYIAFKP